MRFMTVGPPQKAELLRGSLDVMTVTARLMAWCDMWSGGIWIGDVEFVQSLLKLK